MEQVTWVRRQNADGSDHRRRWFGEASRRGMMAQCREDNDMPEHTTGTVSSLELATSEVHRVEGLCVLTSSLVERQEGHPVLLIPQRFSVLEKEQEENQGDSQLIQVHLEIRHSNGGGGDGTSAHTTSTSCLLLTQQLTIMPSVVRYCWSGVRRP